ncbi:hypothetical protein [Streptomyces decoyicus]|uniref:hypothetical protein n=1 Tax=Streptomyces decoyicus TaxID=249567 RepID=UPI002E173A6E|nr:hypothetical protein OG532_39905 [Streptomyces decoyicus]
MPWDEKWLISDEVAHALDQLDAHYALLGNGIGDPQFDAFLRDIEPYQTRRAGTVLRSALQSLAATGRTEHTVYGLSWGSLVSFLEPAPALAEISSEEVVVDADLPFIPVGLDGEAVTLPTPVRCRISPGTLRVRVPRHRPGTAPSGRPPDRGAIRRVASAVGRAVHGRHTG